MAKSYHSSTLPMAPAMRFPRAAPVGATPAGGSEGELIASEERGDSPRVPVPAGRRSAGPVSPDQATSTRRSGSAAPVPM
jgi:hypothetical protein